MRQRCVLGVLYLLHTVVLSGVVATYIRNNNSGHKPPEAPSLPPKHHQTSPIGRDENVKHEKKTKHISFVEVLENIPKVRTVNDFYRMFAANSARDVDIEKMIELHPEDNDNAWPKKRRRNRFRKAISAYKDGGREGSYKEMEHARLKVKALDVISGKLNDEGSGIEYQNDAPSTQNSSWSKATEVLQAAIDHVYSQEADSASFECQVPTPFFHRPQRPWSIFMPDCIKLYRCMNFTGCCKHPRVCSPKKVQLVQKVFLVVQIPPMYSPNDKHLSYDDLVPVSLTFENHTECACAVPKKTNTCNRACPIPFIVNMELSKCTCICPQTNPDVLQECSFIQQGLKPLTEKDKECVKSTNCYHPSCEIGLFDVSTGLCPLSTTYALPSHQFLNPLNHSDYRSHIPGFAKNETGGNIDTPFKVLSTTKSPERIKNEQALAGIMARLNPHISSAYHEGHQHRQPSTSKPDVKVSENATVEVAKVIAKMPNPGMSGSYHENYRPFRPLPVSSEKRNETVGKTDHTFNNFSTTKSPERLKNEQVVASALARQNPHISSSYHERHQHRLPTKLKPDVKVSENATTEGEKIIAKMPNHSMNGSAHENILPIRALPVVTKMVNINESLSSNGSLNNMTETADDTLENVRNMSCNNLNESRNGIPDEAFPISNLSTGVNNGIILNPVSPPKDKVDFELQEQDTDSEIRCTTPNMELEKDKSNNSESLPSSEDGDQLRGASKHVPGPPVQSASDRLPARDTAPDLEDYSKDQVH